MSVRIDARSHTVAELMEKAREAAREHATTVIAGCNHVSTHEIVAITSAGQGYVSFLLEPPAPAGKGAKV